MADNYTDEEREYMDRRHFTEAERKEFKEQLELLAGRMAVDAADLVWYDDQGHKVWDPSDRHAKDQLRRLPPTSRRVNPRSTPSE